MASQPKGVLKKATKWERGAARAECLGVGLVEVVVGETETPPQNARQTSGHVCSQIRLLHKLNAIGSKRTIIVLGALSNGRLRQSHLQTSPGSAFA
jgi:hypothetical protein